MSVLPETLLVSYCYTAQGFGKSEAPNAAFSVQWFIADDEQFFAPRTLIVVLHGCTAHIAHDV
jgi:hypothetical protein